MIITTSRITRPILLGVLTASAVVLPTAAAWAQEVPPSPTFRVTSTGIDLIDGDAFGGGFDILVRWTSEAGAIQGESHIRADDAGWPYSIVTDSESVTWEQFVTDPLPQDACVVEVQVADREPSPWRAFDPVCREQAPVPVVSTPAETPAVQLVPPALTQVSPPEPHRTTTPPATTQLATEAEVAGRVPAVLAASVPPSPEVAGPGSVTAATSPVLAITGAPVERTAVLAGGTLLVGAVGVVARARARRRTPRSER